MGLIKAAAGAFGGTMADQWKEHCDAIDKDVLVVKGESKADVLPTKKAAIILFQAVPELLLQMVSV